MVKKQEVAIQNGKASVLSVQSRLNNILDSALTAAVSSAIKNGSTKVILNLADCPSVDSAGVHTLISCYKQASDAGATLAISQPNQRVKRVLDTTRLSKIIATYGSVEEAL